MTGLLIRDCDIEGIGRADVRVRDGVVVEITPGLQPADEETVSADGGALIPGLHDHHLHLFALAASLESVDCSPDSVRDSPGLSTALRVAAARGPVRGTGYFESVAGPLDRDVLDAVVTDAPVRVQHRSGAAWFLNSAALADFGLLEATDPAVERDPTGRVTGRLLRGDHLLRRPNAELPDLRDVGRLLTSYGVSGVTDATPRLDDRQADLLWAAHETSALPQRLVLLGTPLSDPEATGVPWKILVDAVSGLDPTGLADEVQTAHDAGRSVALHCTSRVETVLAVTLLRNVGFHRGDRLEHAGVLPPEFDEELQRAGVTVITQPHFIAERGDDYLADVEPVDHDLLYRCGTLLDAGVRVAAGTDAPYGRADPWAVIAAAVHRRTHRGDVVGAADRVTARRALDLFLGEPLDPGGLPRQITPGSVADFCLLATPLAEMLSDPDADRVAATVVGGHVVHRRDDY